MTNIHDSTFNELEEAIEEARELLDAFIASVRSLENEMETLQTSAPEQQQGLEPPS